MNAHRRAVVAALAGYALALALLPAVTLADDAPGTSSPGSMDRHTVVAGDTLSRLAATYYHDASKWPIIVDANPSLQASNRIYPGQILVIPSLPRAAAADGGPAPDRTSASEASPETIGTDADIAAEPGLPPSPVADLHSQSNAPVPSRKSPALSEFSEAPESLSTSFPGGLVGMYPSVSRFKAPPRWKQDGQVVPADQAEILAAQGDMISLQVDAGSAPGLKYWVLRKSAAADDDQDQQAAYLAKIGEVEVQRPYKGIYRALVLSANDAIQIGDVIEKE